IPCRSDTSCIIPTLPPTWPLFLPVLLFCCPGPHPAPPSFPTRRSSDGHGRRAGHAFRPARRLRRTVLWLAALALMLWFFMWLQSLSAPAVEPGVDPPARSEEHTSELQSRENLVCRLLLEKKKNNRKL